LSGLDTQLQGIREALLSAATTLAARAEASAKPPEPIAAAPAPAPARLEVRLESEAGASLAQLVTKQSELLRHALTALTQAPSARPDAELAALKAAIEKLGRQLGHGVPGVRRVDVDLQTEGPSNFYRSVMSEDVWQDGGLFVATYEKPPPLGADVLVSVEFPAGSRCEFVGSVAWFRDHLGDDAPAGFGVRFLELSEPARALISGYCGVREPLLWDD